MEPGLSSHPARASAPLPLDDPEHWERSLLTALQLAPEDIDPHEAAAALHDLSSLHRLRPLNTGRLHKPTPDGTMPLLIRGLFFARRTYLWARALSPLLPEPTRGGVVEHGAGWGPALAALRPRWDPACAVEAHPEYATLAARFHATAGLDAPPFLAPGAAVPLGALHVYGASFAEIARWDPHLGAQMIRSHIARDGGTCLILEPGDIPHAQLLQRCRDLLAAQDLHPIAPCPATALCPFSDAPRGWCHFTHPYKASPLEHRIAQIAGRRSDHHHFSFLLYGASPPSRPLEPHAGRLIATQLHGRSKVLATVCTSSGLATWSALRRTGAPGERLASLLPGSQVALSAEPRRTGDGLRIERPGDLVVSWLAQANGLGPRAVDEPPVNDPRE